MLKIVISQIFFGDGAQSEKLSEIKLPLWNYGLLFMRMTNHLIRLLSDCSENIKTQIGHYKKSFWWGFITN